MPASSPTVSPITSPSCSRAAMAISYDACVPPDGTTLSSSSHMLRSHVHVVMIMRAHYLPSPMAPHPRPVCVCVCVCVCFALLHVAVNRLSVTASISLPTIATLPPTLSLTLALCVCVCVCVCTLHLPLPLTVCVCHCVCVCVEKFHWLHNRSFKTFPTHPSSPYTRPLLSQYPQSPTSSPPQATSCFTSTIAYNLAKLFCYLSLVSCWSSLSLLCLS
jgi:hypothetical protein